MRQIQVLTFLFISLVAWAAHAQQPTCQGQIKWLDENNGVLDYQFGDRHLTFVGWTHATVVEKLEFVDVLKDVLANVKISDCSAAQKDMDVFVQNSPVRKMESQFVLSSLQTSYAKHHFPVIGVEFSSADMAAVKKPNDPTDAIGMALTKWTAQCPQLDGHAFHKIWPDPSFEFADELHSGIQVKAVEDEKIKTKWVSKLSAVLNFDLKTSGFSQKTKDLINNLGATIQPGEEQALLDSESDPVLKSKLYELYQGRLMAFQSIHERNSAILTNLLNNTGNVAMVIGSAHLPDFLSQLDILCKGTTPVASSSAQAPVVSTATVQD